ncbi:MAG: LamG-like jellyroll fold domain-containing protein, partial [Verrucomicrobiota bacterium]
MKTHIVFILTGLIACQARAKEQRWPLDTWPEDGLQSHGGTIRTADGTVQKCLVLDGRTTLQTTHWKSGRLTAAIWVNAYAIDRGQQMIMAKNRYSLNQREWGVMIDKDRRIKLYVWQGRWQILDSGYTPRPGHWCHVLVRLSDTSADLWIDGQPTASAEVKKGAPHTQTPLTFGGVNDNGRIRQNLFGALDDARWYDRLLSDEDIAKLYQPVTSTHRPPKPKVYPLWSGPSIPNDPTHIPFAEGVEHRTLHDARHHDHKFLHGAALIRFKDVFFANWANSPKNENQQFETLQGRRSADGGKTWSEVELVAPGFDGLERHSHGVYLEHKGRLWTFAARF